MEFCVLVVRESFEEGGEMKKKFLFSYSLELLDHWDYYISARTFWIVIAGCDQNLMSQLGASHKEALSLSCWLLSVC